jgi:hypothetical protein
MRSQTKAASSVMFVTDRQGRTNAFGTLRLRNHDLLRLRLYGISVPAGSASLDGTSGRCKPPHRRLVDTMVPGSISAMGPSWGWRSEQPMRLSACAPERGD